ncbi:MAG: MOSC domain-containing protein [Chloroflexi bacterium]|nr:MOSC domain-containing protein [Chloroflexota bacterium]
MATIHQLNVSKGGVPKTAIPQAMLSALGLEGDGFANPKFHGGPDRALCLYALERIEALQVEGHSIFPGAIGENVTTVGLDWNLVVPGARLALGDCLIEIVRYTTPCMTTGRFVSGDLKRYHHEHNPGWSRVYARVLTGGLLRVGDPVRIEK